MPSRSRPEIVLREQDGQRWLVIALAPRPNAKEIVPARPVVVEAWISKHGRVARQTEEAR
jgi:hypothetical protein